MNNNKTDLYIDFDSTLAMSDKAFTRMYNENFKDHPDFVPADWTKHYDWTYSQICPLLHTGNEDPHLITRTYYNSKTLFEYLELFPNAYDVLVKLKEKYNIIICTSAFPKNASHKVLWIEEHLPIVDEIIILINNTGNGIGKARVPMMESDAIFIDDHPHNLHSTKATTKCLFKSHDTEYNQGWNGPIFTNWLEVEAALL